MKIIATSEQANKKEEDRRIANIGCDICPCCKSKNVEYRFTHYETKWKFYFFYMGLYDVDRWSCNDCGSVWESEPYNKR